MKTRLPKRRNNIRNSCIIALLLIVLGCGGKQSSVAPVRERVYSSLLRLRRIPLCAYEKLFLKIGLIDVQQLEPKIKVNLKYSSAENLMGYDAYGDLKKAYLQKDVAEKLALAQKYLEMESPGLCLQVYDAARPCDMQKVLWDSVKMPAYEKIKYISNPTLKGFHNYGAAVDLTIIDNKGKELDMGTSFDCLGDLAAPCCEEQMKYKGVLSQQQIDNRKLLRSVMRKAGFYAIPYEWWHFNACTRQYAEQHYPLIDG